MSKKILLVEERAPILYFFSLILRAQGHLVTQCINPDELSQALKREKYDIVLIDLDSVKIDSDLMILASLCRDKSIKPFFMARCRELYLEDFRKNLPDLDCASHLVNLPVTSEEIAALVELEC